MTDGAEKRGGRAVLPAWMPLQGRELAAMAAGALLLVLLPLVITDTYTRHLIILVFIYASVASSWDLSLGYAGIFNFGHLALFAIGLYSYALATKFGGVNGWAAIPLAGLMAMIAAAIVTVPILRLKGIYIILVTFAFSQLVLQLVVSQSDWTGGTLGMTGVPSLKLPGHNFIRDGKIGYYYTALVLLGANILFLRIFVRSPLGLSIVALRDNEEYAVSRGISLARQRLLTMVASAMFTGMAGGLYGAYVRNASIEAFGIGLLTLILSMVLLGGTATIYGSLLAGFVLVFLDEVMIDLGAWRPITIALLIILVMLVYPGGLFGGLRALAGRLMRKERT